VFDVSRRKKLIKVLSFVVAIGLGVCAVTGQQVTANLRGHVSDERGAIITGAELTIRGANGVHRVTTTNNEGNYSFGGLAPSVYVVRASAPGFETYENADVTLSGPPSAALDITLKVAPIKQNVAVPLEGSLRPDPDNNASAVVLKGDELDALPDDPDQLVAALQALAGVSAGPDGGQIFIDGFTGGRNPPKGSIREVRINQNPFSAEFDRPGFGRIEILTKVGASKFAGSAFFGFNDERLNSRNPFALNRPPFQYRLYGGDAGGPLVGKHSSFFADFERREIDDNAIINAVILDPGLRVTSLNQVAPVPRRRTNLSPRLDYQPNKNNTLIGRYTYTRADINNMGVGDFSLLSRAYDSSSKQQTVQLTETVVVNKWMVNEARFQYAHELQQLNGKGSASAIVVLDSFMSGSSPVGLSKLSRDRYELGDYATFAPGKHTIRVGVRLRGIRIADLSPYNYGGTLTFGGGFAAQLDSNNQVVLDFNGQPLIVPITSIERYRRTLFFQMQGRSKTEIRALGGGATQFAIASGNPEARVSQTDIGAFIQDDWRLRSNLTVDLGLRYEAQGNIRGNLNFAPRVAFGWSPATKGQASSRTVIRGGFGIFYSRISEDLTLQAHRFNAFNQQQYIVTDPIALDLLSSAPTASEVSNFAQTQTTRRLGEDIRSPYSIQSTISLERQLPLQLKLSVAYINARVLHVLRTRNVNAPMRTAHATESRPSGNLGNIYEYESSGVFNQNQLVASLSGRLGRNISLNAIYTLSKAESDTDGLNTFPAYSYDLSTEYGRSVFDIRHRFFLSGSASLPWGIRLSPLIVAASSRPFNITTGRDTNGDTIFSERPAIAKDFSKPGVVITPFGALDLSPLPGDEIIPRNYGRGPRFFALNLRASKTIRFGVLGKNRSALAASTPRQTPGGPTAPKSTEKKYTLTLSLQAWNLFNHTNVNIPVGNVSSPFFGRANSIAGSFGTGDPLSGNRLVELQMRFSF
jgi:hypothetical protein